MASAPINKVQDKNGDQFFPITHQQAVINDDGDNLVTILGGKQPLDADLSAIAALSAASTGVLKKTGDGTWAIDTDTFYTSGNCNNFDTNWNVNNLTAYRTIKVQTGSNYGFDIVRTGVSSAHSECDNEGLYLSSTLAGNTSYFRLKGGVGVGVGKTPSNALDVNGNIAATGTITPGSDSRIKDNQKEIDATAAMEIIASLAPKTWIWNERTDNAGKKAAGLVAQEVAKVIPEAVLVSDGCGFKDFHSLNYNAIQGYEIAAIKGLIEEVKALRAELAELKKMR